MLEDHELLELLLFGVIPRQNTNDIAHDLISRCGSFNAVFNAPEETLMQISGVGENAAVHIKAVKQCIERYCLYKYSGGNYVSNFSRMKEYLNGLFYCAEVEKAYVLLLSNSKRVIHCEMLEKGTAAYSRIDPARIVKLATDKNAAMVAIAHNHPDGDVDPSEQDVRATERIKELVESMNIGFLDHFIVNGDSCYPILYRASKNKRLTFYE